MNGNGWGGYGYINKEKMKDFKYNYVDSSYARIVLDCGIIFTGVILLLYTIALLNYSKKGKKAECFIILVVLLWCFIEPIIIDIGRNIFVIFLIPLLEYGNINKIIKKDEKLQLDKC